eukprot:scaffold187105_cov31-Tisochrysis_lutea.AAC.3
MQRLRWRGTRMAGTVCPLRLLLHFRYSLELLRGAPRWQLGSQLVADDRSEDRAVEERVAAQPVVAVDPASHLARRMQPQDDRAVVAQHGAISAHPDPAHCVVEDGHNAPSVQRPACGQEGRVPEERLAELVHALNGGRVVCGERPLDGALQRGHRLRVGGVGAGGDLLGRLAVRPVRVGDHPPGERRRVVQLDHQPLAEVVFDVLARLVGHRVVEQEHKLLGARVELGRHHLVARQQLVDEACAGRREQHAADAPHHLAAERLGGRRELARVEEAGR